MIDKFDVCLATDARFVGGSSSSTSEELRANESMGIETRFYQCMSTTLRNAGRSFNPKLQDHFRKHPRRLTWSVRLETKPACKVLFFRHPSVVNRYTSLPPVVPDCIKVIVNHPMRNARGRFDFDLSTVRSIIARNYGLEPHFLAISSIIRDSYSGKQFDLIDAEQYWFNFFHAEPGALSPESRYERQAQLNLLTIGRHSRDGVEKWPSSAGELMKAYPLRPDIAVRVLGGVGTVEGLLGRVPNNWTAFAFGSRPVGEFLNELDVFVYFHHPRWIEAFGRVIAEAMIAGIPTILPKYFSSLYGEAAICCAPDDVGGALARLRSDKAYYVEVANAGKRLVASKFSWDMHARRMQGLLRDAYTPPAIAHDF